MKRLKETLGGIAGRLHAFGTGTFGEVGSSYSPDVRLFDSMMSNKITYVSLPTMGKDESARNFAKMLLADLRSAIARASNTRSSPTWLIALSRPAGRRPFLLSGSVWSPKQNLWCYMTPNPRMALGRLPAVRKGHNNGYR